MKNDKQIDIANLWREYHKKRTQEIREAIVQQYLSLVKIVAGRIAIGLPQHVDKDDLISNGFFGLLDAIERFDIERGIKFETYAVTRIRGAILDALRSQDWIPTALRQKAKQYEQIISKLENELGRSATDDELAQAMNLTQEQLQSLQMQLNTTTLISLDEYAGADLLSSHTPNPSQAIEEQEVKQILAQAIDRLPEKERLVVSLYYHEELTLKEISILLELSEARISQLHTKAIYRLRGSFSRLKSSLF